MPDPGPGDSQCSQVSDLKVASMPQTPAQPFVHRATPPYEEDRVHSLVCRRKQGSKKRPARPVQLQSFKCLSRLELRSNKMDKGKGEFQHAHDRAVKTQRCPLGPFCSQCLTLLGGQKECRERKERRKAWALFIHLQAGKSQNPS